MSEEDKEIKISFPLFTFNEEAQLENTLNFHLDEFVNEINKTMSKDKDIIILKKVIDKQQKEIEELNLQNIELKQQKIIDNCSIPTQKNFNEYYNYISKDKIREKIKELEQIQNTALTGTTIEIMDYKITILKFI